MSKAEVALFIGPASHHFEGDPLPASRTFLCVFSYSTAEAVQPFLTGPVAVQPFRNPQSFDGVHEPIWAHEKDRGFASYDELRAFLHSLGPAEVTAYREVGRDFMASERFRPLSREAYAELLGQLLEKDAGLGAKTRVA